MVFGRYGLGAHLDNLTKRISQGISNYGHRIMLVLQPKVSQRFTGTDGRRTGLQVTGTEGDSVSWGIASLCVMWVSNILTSKAVCDSKKPGYGSGVIGPREGEPAVVGADGAAIIVASGSTAVAVSVAGVELAPYC
jgi:hypothetical protein